MLTTIGFDADDTLWQNETFFRLTQDRFADLLRRTMPRPIICTNACLPPNGATSAQYGLG
jgi:hypothetical protein